MYEQNKHPIPYDVANELSKALGMSQKALEEHIGVIPSYYYKLEAGHRRPSRKAWLRRVELLNQTHPYHSLLKKHTLQ